MNRVEVVNCSWSFKPNGEIIHDGIVKSIKALIRDRVTVVVVAGNYGPLINTLNPLALINGVISVGAASKDGAILADFSSRGIPGDTINKPTIVAPGIDIIVQENELQELNKYNQSCEVLEREIYLQNGRIVNIPKKDLLLYRPISGTSFSCAIVSGVILRLIQMRKRLGLYYDPFVFKQILEEIAIPVPNRQEHEIGAGFVSANLVKQYFSKIDCLCIGNNRLWGNNKQLSELWNLCLG